MRILNSAQFSNYKYIGPGNRYHDEWNSLRFLCLYLILFLYLLFDLVFVHITGFQIDWERDERNLSLLTKLTLQDSDRLGKYRYLPLQPVELFSYPTRLHLEWKQVCQASDPLGWVYFSKDGVHVKVEGT